MFRTKLVRTPARHSQGVAASSPPPFGNARPQRRTGDRRSLFYDSRMLRIIFLLSWIVCAFAIRAEPAKSDRHVVVVVWDGMRPDFVSEERTPRLWKLAREGATFRNHHAVYPSATQVNGTALVTGIYPGRSSVIANYAYRPEIDRMHSVSVESPTVVAKGDELSGGKYISVPTIADLLQRAAWTTKAVTDFLWKDGVPVLSVIWLGEPDLTEHESAPGAPPALAAIKSSDENLAVVLAALDSRVARQTTDLFVVSDHGFSTIGRSVDLRKILKDSGFVAKTEFDGQPKPGDIMLVGNGGSVLFYVIGQDTTVTRRLVEFLQQSDFAGVIFTKQGLPGTFHLNDAKIDNAHAPDVVMAFRWNDSKNQFGTPGMIDADWQRAA